MRRKDDKRKLKREAHDAKKDEERLAKEVGDAPVVELAFEVEASMLNLVQLVCTSCYPHVLLHLGAMCGPSALCARLIHVRSVSAKCILALHRHRCDHRHCASTHLTTVAIAAAAITDAAVPIAAATAAVTTTLCQLELRRLKNIKRQEIERRLAAIRDMSGGGQVDEAALEGDFDPDNWDKQVCWVPLALSHSLS
jgi:KRI1-like family